MRFFIQFSYDGTNYHGWQKQPNADSVQDKMNKAISTILNTNIELVGAGRTDAGVHAHQMFAHFDCDLEIQSKILTNKINGFLPSDIAINDIFRVKKDANCRFDAIDRTYKYRIISKKNPFVKNAYFFKKKLNIKNMNLACKNILGKKDFTSFSKVKTQTYTNICHITKAEWVESDNELIFIITADRFLRNMVRAIVGTLMDVGMGKINPDFLNDIISQKDRSKSGVSVPANGLSIIKVNYHNSIRF